VSLRTYPLIAHPAFLDFVSESISKKTSFEDTLAPAPKAELPEIRDVRDIATYLGISPELTWTMLLGSAKHYRQFPVRKRSGKVRTISAPRTYLKVVQWWILDTILSHGEVSDRAYGFVRGRSFVDNARVHVGSNYIINVDIEDFFPSISRLMILDWFNSIGYGSIASLHLSALTTYEGVLPQGAPTSPSLANLVFKPFDNLIESVSAKYGVIYSRYADDLTFSSSEKISAGIIADIEAALSPTFSLNAAKTRFMGRNQSKEVTGVTLGKDGVCLDRDYLNGIRGWINTLSKDPVGSSDEIERLRGTLAFVRMVGGRGSGKILSAGRDALISIEKSLFKVPPI